MRHRIDAMRPGTSIHTPHGFVSTNPVDGGATLTKEQMAYFKAAGYKLVAIGGPEPEVPELEPDPDALAQASQNQREADRALRDGLRPLRKKNNDPKRR